MGHKEGDSFLPMTIYAWDCVDGLRNITRKTKFKDKHLPPVSVLNYFLSKDVNERSILILQNFHRFLGPDMGIIQTILN